MVSERTDPLVNTMLGKDYRVIEPIGFGGMAVVYLVEHQTLQKRFAAKVLSVELTKNFEARARFNLEAHAASQLDHENIVNISDFGVTEDQRPYFVMELLRGQTLDQRLAEGPMSLEEVVAVSVPVGRALAFAHAEGIVHRDVKPENIFLVQRSQGRWGIKVVDFGIAKTPLSDHLTKMGQTLGSPHYMSPEACRGDDVDHRADLYSYGVLLYLMTCGKLPFDDPSLLKVLQLHVTEPLVRPSVVNPALPAALCAVIERALAKHPDERHASMEALLHEFESAIPPGAERLLVEQQSGGAASFRATPFPHPSQRMRAISDSIPRIRAPGDSVPSLPVTAHPAARKPKRTALVAALVIGILVIGGLGVMLVMKPSDEQGGPAVAKVEPSLQASPVTREPPRPTSSESPKATTRRYLIETKPSGATVTVNGTSIGVTPLSIDREVAAGTGELVIEKSGFQSVTKQIQLDAEVTLDVELARKIVTDPRKVEKKPVIDRKPADKPPTVTKGADSTKGDPTLDIRLTR
ncbi:MAG: protein kinase [Myxococcota bacterium]|nr:protein kinase [Myxococcota bacterium]